MRIIGMFERAALCVKNNVDEIIRKGERESHMPTSVVEEQQPAPTPPSRPQTASFRRVLKNRNFVLLWLAQLISLTILNAANFGIIVLVNEVTHSVVMAGVAIIAFTLPAVPFSAVGGVGVDRLTKPLVLWVRDFLDGLAILLVGGRL